MKDYYYILGLEPNANLQDIKTAFRKLSKKFHPDVNDGDPFFTERFKEIQEAYETLSDTNKRKRYNYNKNYTQTEREEPELPNIKTFATDKTNYVINETVTINWAVHNAKKVDISLFGNVADNGSKTIKFKKPKDDLAITLSATNKQGNQVAETIHIAVDGYTDANPHYEFDKETNSINWSKIFIETGILAFTILATYLMYALIKSNVEAAFLFSKFDSKEDEKLFLPTTINTLCLLIPAIFAYIIRPFRKEIKNWFTELKLISIVKNFIIDVYIDLLKVMKILSPAFIIFFILIYCIKKEESKKTFRQDNNKLEESYSKANTVAFENLQKIRLSKIYQTLPKLNDYGSQSDFNRAMLESRTNREKLYNKLPSLQKIGTFDAIESYLNSPMESLIELPFKREFKIGDVWKPILGMAKVEDIYKLLVDNKIISNNTNIDEFKSASEEQIRSLHQVSVDKGLISPNTTVDVFLDFFNGTEKKSIPYFKGNQLENGVSPYEYYFGKSVYESNSLHSIKFKASKISDVIVCLAKVYDNAVIRLIHFLRC